jgi:translation initiation factor IF-2
MQLNGPPNRWKDADEFKVKAEKAIVVNDEDILFDDSEEEDEE